MALFEHEPDLTVPERVLVDVEYWLRKAGGLEAWRLFTRDLADGVYHLKSPTTADVARASELQVGYSDLRLGFVDAPVIALCERLQKDRVATLDRRHFSVVRPAHAPYLNLLPA